MNIYQTSVKQKLNLLDLCEKIQCMANDQLLITDLFSNENENIFNVRTKIVQWILFLCKKMNLSRESAFRAVHLLDLYLSESGRTKEMASSNLELEMRMVGVVCLNLATKLHEICCNYTSFFQRKLLNDENNRPMFTVKELTDKEMEVLKAIKFKTQTPTLMDFNDIFYQIGANELINNQGLIVNVFNKSINSQQFFLNYLNQLNYKICQHYVQMKESIFTSPLASGLICLLSSTIALGIYTKTDLRMVLKCLIYKLNLITKDEELITNCQYVAYNFAMNFINDNPQALLEC